MKATMRKKHMPADLEFSKWHFKNSESKQTGENGEKDECSQIHWGLWRKPALDCMWPETQTPSSPFSVTMAWRKQSRQCRNGFQYRSLIFLEWSSQSPDLNAIVHLWRDLKKAVHFPSNLMDLKRICHQGCDKLPKFRCEMLETYPRRLEPLIAAKVASTKTELLVWIYL